MAYNTKPIVKDKDGNPISQYYNPNTDIYEPVEGSHGANKVMVENNDLSLIPILDKLSQLTGTVIDEETRKSNELERIANEESREMAEDERDIAEQDRQSKEQNREDKEELRITAENDRVTKELERISNENTRKSNEDDRISAENTRDSNETKRVNAENVRIDNESQRESAEVVRRQNEESRKSAELDRVDNEQLRNSAEWDRRRNENARQDAMDAFSVWENYSSVKTYYPLNKVFYDGSSYICIAETKGNLPTDTDYWLVLARRGVDGEGAGDMLMEVYDTNGDGVVDNADNANKLGGYEPSYYVPGHLFSDTYDSLVNSLNGKVDNDRVKTDVPENAKFTDTTTTINGKTGAISKADIVALGIPAQDTNTTYSEITTAEIDAGTSSTLRTISGRRVQHILNKVQGWINGLTKSDIGLSNVDNVKQATKTEFDAHTADNMFKSIQITRDAQITGSQSVSLGFKPDAVILLAGIDGTKLFSVGIAAFDGTRVSQFSFAQVEGGSFADTFRGQTDAVVQMYTTTSNSASASVYFESDGIRLNWSKVGNGADGTIRVQILAFRH